MLNLLLNTINKSLENPSRSLSYNIDLINNVLYGSVKGKNHVIVEDFSLNCDENRLKDSLAKQLVELISHRGKRFNSLWK